MKISPWNAKILSLVLSSALIFPGLAAAMSMDVPHSRLNAQPLTPGGMGSIRLAPALDSIEALRQAMAANPAGDFSRQFQTIGVDFAQLPRTPGTVMKIRAAVSSLPSGPARERLMRMSAMLAAPPGGSVSSIDLSSIYDNTAVIKAAEEALIAGPWERLANHLWMVPPIQKILLAKVEKSLPAARPAKDFELPVESLRWTPAPELLPKSTKDLPGKPDQVIGQEQAMADLRRALSMPGPGYSVYVSGFDGMGREKAVSQVLSELAPKMPTPPDLVSVTNFEDMDQPVTLRFDAGRGKDFVAGMQQFLEDMQAKAPALFLKMSQSLQAEADQKKAEALDGIQALVAKLKVGRGRFGVAIQKRAEENGRYVMFLTLGDEPLDSQEKIENLIETKQATSLEIEQAIAEMLAKAKPILDGMIRTQDAYQEEKGKAASEELKAALKAQLGKPFGIGRAVLLAAQNNAEAGKYVQQLFHHAVGNFNDFLPPDDPKEEKMPPEELYRASVMVENTPGAGAPVIMVKDPTRHNIFGSFTPNSHGRGGPSVGGPTLEPGAYARANGGYLILDVVDVLKQKTDVLEAIMQALTSGQAGLLEDGAGPMAEEGGKQHYVPSTVKVILIGPPHLRDMLAEDNRGFRKHFNASVNFDLQLKIDDATIAGYVDFIKSSIVKSAGMIRDFEQSGIAAVLEYAARLAESNEKLTAEFGEIYKLLREASQWGQAQALVSRAHVEAVLAERQARDIDYKAHMEEYSTGRVRVETSGSKVGQVNSLTILLGKFGVASRATATQSEPKGEGGVEDLDQKVGWAGDSYRAGVAEIDSFILSLFSKDRQGRSQPFPARVHVKKEQLYGGIDGDSSTGAKMTATVSLLADAPILQIYSMTGSADQYGNLQVIGGANEKIEGFFEICKAHGLTGDQGVIIPVGNVANLQLSSAVVEAVKAGKFHIYAVNHVSEELEIVTRKSYAALLYRASRNLDQMRAASKSRR